MLRFGVCYYPEQWTEEEAANHVKLMGKARINVVRMGEFAWCKFEPEQGRYKFEWMDRVIESLHKEGIDTVLCTPTAVPPMWVFTRHPNILQMDEYGRRRNPGSRHHCCKNASEFQMLCDVIVQELAKHYGKMSGVIGWQVDSELGCHQTARCYCEHCEKAFRQWLVAKYQDIERVNEAWGTAFWGFDFHQWNEIPLPRAMPAGNNPGHWLDFARFSSETQVAFFKRQREILKIHGPNQFVTHNAMAPFSEVDCAALSKNTDFLSWNNYPARGDDPFRASYGHETTRSCKGSFWVMEEKAGPVGSAKDGLAGETPEPGDLRRWAWQAVANGADGLCFFRWRTPRVGAEQLSYGILDRDGVPRRRYKEILRTGEEFAKVGPEIEGALVDAKVALMRSCENLWIAARQPGTPGFNYDEHCFSYYRAVKRSGHLCDIVAPDADLARYATLFAPCLAVADAALAERLETYVKDGGTLVLTPRSGTRTASGAMHVAAPGPLQELVGARAEETIALRPGRTLSLNIARGALIAQQCTVNDWLEVLECTTAQSFAEYLDGRFKGKTGITHQTLGKGQVYYVGVCWPQDILERFVLSILPEYRIKEVPEGVEITQRKSKGGRFVFLINHSGERRSLKLPGTFPDLLTGEDIGPAITLSAHGILVLKA